MSINFPTSLDTTTQLPTESSSTPLSTNHVTAHTNLAAAVIALEAKVGINSSAVTTTIDYKLSGVTGSDLAVSKTGTEIITNKTLSTGTKVLLGSDATGDIYYNGGSGVLTRLAKSTDNFILTLASGVPTWRAETAIVNASTTAKGIVELATAAEITAGTAIGGTGAALVVTPDQLALSTPVFDGSGLTNSNVSILTAGNTITAGQSLCNYWYTTDGGVTFDNKDTSSISSGTTVTKSYTIGNQTNRILVVSITSNVAPSVLTYNGTSFLANLIDSQALNASYVLYTYYLLAPTIGVNNLIVTIGSSGNAVITINSFYNVSQSGQPESHAKGTNSNAGAAASITTIANGAVVLAVTGSGTGISSGTYGTITKAENGLQTIVSSAPHYGGSAYSNPVYPAAQTFTQTHNGSQGGSWTEGLISISIAPVTAPINAVVPSSSATSLYGQNLYTAFVGFAAESKTVGQSIKVFTTKIATGLSGLTPNTQYFLNDTAGTIGTSAGTNSKKVGISLSATTILVTNIW